VTSVTAWHALMRAPWRFLSSRWPWRALVYLMLSALLAIVLLPLTVLTLLALPLWGIVVGAIERRRTRLLGFSPQTSGHVPLTGMQRHIWLSVRITERATWRETIALLVDLGVGLLALATLIGEVLVFVVAGFVVAAGIGGPSRINLFADVVITVRPDTWWPVIPLVVLAVCVFAYVNTALAAGQVSLLRVLCGPRQREIARNIERLVQSRAALVDAFESERRRIERDLHDGVQQELVTLATHLGMVSLELDDLEAQGARTVSARASLDAAQQQAEHAMATLRDTVRGIHPAVLTDHGLAAAVDELAGRAALPLVISMHTVGRLPRPVETAAFYVVTEAITNAAKHAAASVVTVHAHADDETFTMTITDDGHGGADEVGGTGLRGMRERAETAGGRFTVVSPTGGPTTLHLQLPVVVERNGHHAPAAG